MERALLNELYLFYIIYFLQTLEVGQEANVVHLVHQVVKLSVAVFLIKMAKIYKSSLFLAPEPFFIIYIQYLHRSVWGDL